MMTSRRAARTAATLRRVARGLVVLLAALLAGAAEAATLVVAAEDIDYLPFHAVGQQPPRGFFVELIERFAAAEGHEVVWRPLPIRRLARLRRRMDQVDLIYPANPGWRSGEEGAPVHYSAPVLQIVGGTMVRPEQRTMPLSAFRRLSLPRGFTPIEWQPLIDAGVVELLATADATAALTMVLRGRADGADVEYHVARHLLEQIGRPDALVLADSLPLSTTAFHVAGRDAALIARFDRFLEQHADEIAALRRSHRIGNAEQGSE